MAAQTTITETDAQQPVFAGNVVAPEQDNTLSLSDLELHLDAAQQRALDRVLDHLNESGLMPVIEVKGDLISLTLELNSQFLDLLPETLLEDGKIVMERVVTALCSYADTTGFGGFGLRMEFRK